MGQGNEIKGQRAYPKGRNGKAERGHSLGTMNCSSTDIADPATIIEKVVNEAGEGILPEQTFSTNEQ